jgi:hypothetical protein
MNTHAFVNVSILVSIPVKTLGVVFCPQTQEAATIFKSKKFYYKITICLLKNTQKKGRASQSLYVFTDL